MHLKGKLIIIYGPIQGHWCLRWNSNTDLNFVDDIKIIRLGWVGQIIRMEERSPMKILNGEFHNTGSVGKPRTRGKDIVQRDEMQGLGI
jgi:hypothetical protein